MATKQSNIIITANGKQAEAVLKALDNRIKELKNDEAGLKTQMDALRRAGKANSDEYKNLQKQLQGTRREMKQLNDAANSNISNMEKVNKAVKDLANTTTRQLRDALRAGKKELERMSAKDPNMKRLQNDLKQIEMQINKNTGAVKKFGTTHGSVWQTAVRNITAYVGVFGAFNMIIGKLKDVTRLNLAFSDSLADVRKVSGLAIEDINQLAVNLSKIDTRTSLQTLVGNLAYSGAKLGFGEYGIEGLESYVKAANQVNVALGEELGEQAMPALSKITENMGLIKEMGVEKAMLATGSAIFKLASTSTASAGPIVEFSKRLLSIGKNAGLTTDQILALGSAADSMMLMPEVASTALGKLVVAMQTNHNLIEKQLNMTKGTISDAFERGHLMDAMVEVFQKMREKGGINALNSIFKDLGSDGQRLKATLVTMSEQLPILQKHLATSRQALEEATSVTAEYNIQQETAAGIMQRANNMWEKAFINPSGVDMVKEMAKAWYDVSKSLTESQGFMASMRFSLQALFTVLGGLIRLAPAALLALIVRALYALAMGLGAARIGTDGLTAAWSRLSTAMKANVISLVIGLVAQLAITIYSFIAKTDDATESVDKFDMSLNELNKQSYEAEAKLKRFGKAIEEAGMGTKMRQVAIDNFNKEFGRYLSNLLTEKSTAEDLAKAYKEVTKWMRAERALKLKEADITNEVDPRLGWAATKRQLYADVVKGTNLEAYNAEWLTGFAEDNRNMSMSDIGKALGSRFGLSQAQINEVIRQDADPNRSRYQKMAWAGGHTNAQNLASEGEKALFQAMRYIRQARSADFQMRKIDEKYKPEQDLMNKWLERGLDDDTNNPLGNEAPDKEALKAAKAAAAETKRKAAQARRERLQQLRSDLKDAEQEAQAIIDKVSEFYYLQEETIEQQVADGKITREIADRYLLDLKLSKNQTLANARKSIAGKMAKAEWDEYIGKELKRVMVDQGEWSAELAGDIINTDLTYIHNLLARFNGSEAVLGLRSTASFDKLMKGAAVNERDNAKIRAQIAEEVEKILVEYNYVEQAQKSFHANLISLGIMKETYEQYAKRMQEEAKAMAQKDGVTDTSEYAWDLSLPGVAVKGKYKSPEEQLLQQFLSQGAKPYRVNPQDDRSLYVWLQNLMSNYEYDEKTDTRYSTEGWVQRGFPQLEEWAKDIAKYKPEIQKFYFSLITWEDEYYDAKKKAYDRSKRLMQQEWERSGNKQRYDDLDWELNKRGRERKMPGYDRGTTFGQIGGFTALEEDPELAVYQAKIEASQLYLQQLKEEHADELLIREAQRAESEAELAYQEQIMSRINDRINKLHEWTDPIEQFGTDVGEALGTSLRTGESMADSIVESLRKVALAWGQTTIKIIEELMMQRVKQRLLNKAMQSEETAHQTTMSAIEQAGAAARQATTEASNEAKVVSEQVTNATIEGEQVSHNTATLAEDTNMAVAENAVNTSRAAGKTLADLGWWGIPLVAVIVALLNMLLQAALGSGNKKSNSSNSKVNTKLVSGMLTYDGGNVSSYVGDDGHVYNAHRASLPQGTSLVTSPIATTVNGQPALVAERGPEIVIGRRTTRHIMMNEPGLLQHLANLDRRRTFDNGNMTDMLMSGIGSAVNSGQQDQYQEQNRQTLEALTAAVIALQVRLAQPIKAEINKYGTGGLIDEVQSGLKFMNKYKG